MHINMNDLQSRKFFEKLQNLQFVSRTDFRMFYMWTEFSGTFTVCKQSILSYNVKLSNLNFFSRNMTNKTTQFIRFGCRFQHIESSVRDRNEPSSVTCIEYPSGAQALEHEQLNKHNR